MRRSISLCSVGIRLLAGQMGLALDQGNILVCGDTETDLFMLHECLFINPQNTYTVWVSIFSTTLYLSPVATKYQLVNVWH